MFTPKDEIIDQLTPQSSDQNLTEGAEAEADIHTMPDQFRQDSLQPAPGQRLNWLVLGIVIFLALAAVIVGVIWFLNRESSLQPAVQLPPVNANVNENSNINADSNANDNVNAVAEDTLNTASARDAERLANIHDIRSALNLYAATYQQFPLSLSNLVGPFIRELPAGPQPGPSGSQAGQQAYLYQASADQKSYRLAFTLEEDAIWGILNLTKGDYVATAEMIKPAQLVEPEQAEPPAEGAEADLPTTPILPLAPAKGLDSDGDQLTDIEENIFQTDSAKADTDNDGFIDASEIMNFFSPIAANARLLDSGLIGIYQNPSFNYSVFYPKPWSVRSLNAQNTEVIFTSNTGEFIEVIVQENPLGLSAKNWYLDKNKAAAPESLKSVLVGGLPAVQTPDGLMTYLAVGSSIYVLAYDTGNQQQMNFYTTYQLFLKSFIFIEPK